MWEQVLIRGYCPCKVKCFINIKIYQKKKSQHKQEITQIIKNSKYSRPGQTDGDVEKLS